MADLNSAKQALKAELAHAQQGVAYYTSRMEALQKTLEQLDRVDAGLSGKKRSASRTRSATSRAERPKRGRKPRAVTGRGAADSLPSTAGDFWPSLITTQKLSAPEVLQAAIARLGMTPTPDQRKKLANRMVAALNHLVQTRVISDTGSGRARRYFRMSH